MHMVACVYRPLNLKDPQTAVRKFIKYPVIVGILLYRDFLQEANVGISQ